jgi:hypothetical protein
MVEQEVSPQRFNATGVGNLDCPICLRAASLIRVDGLLECGADPRRHCAARFRFTPATETQFATLERVREPEVTAYNRGARLADDLVCLGCGARGYTFCPSCSARQSREAGR